MARRRGGVARLPKEIRELVNIKLQDGIPYSKIGEWLTEQGHPGINEAQIRSWYQGGYGDWLEAQEKMSQVRSKREAALEVTQGNESGVFEAANSELASSQVFEGLNRYRPEMLVEAINENPELYVKLLNTFVRLNKEAQSRRNAQLRLAQLKMKEKERGEAANPGPKEFSAETIRKMQELLGWVAKPEPDEPKPDEGKGTTGSQSQLPDGGEGQGGSTAS